MVSTHLKDISQNGNLPQKGVKIKNLWNHHLDNQLWIFTDSNQRDTHLWTWQLQIFQLPKSAAKQDSIGEFGAFTTLWGRGPDSCGTLSKQTNWATGRMGQETKTPGIFLAIVQHLSYLYSCACMLRPASMFSTFYKWMTLITCIILYALGSCFLWFASKWPCCCQKVSGSWALNLAELWRFGGGFPWILQDRNLKGLTDHVVLLDTCWKFASFGPFPPFWSRYTGKKKELTKKLRIYEQKSDFSSNFMCCQ